MKKDKIFIVLLSFFIVLSLSSLGVLGEEAVNQSYKWNTKELETGMNRDYRYDCPSMEVDNAVGMMGGHNVIRVGHRNTTGYFEFVTQPGLPLSLGTGNLTRMEWGKHYDINMSAFSIHTCICEQTVYHPAFPSNFTRMWWAGGDCNLLPIGSHPDGLDYADCQGISENGRIDGVVYWCERQEANANCAQWRVWITDDTAGSDLQRYDYGMILYKQNHEGDVGLWGENETYDYGIQCLGVDTARVLIEITEDLGNSKLQGVTVNLTNTQTGTIVGGVSDSNGQVIFNLSTDSTPSYWEVRADLDGYSMKYPQYANLLTFLGQTTGFTITMHNLAVDKVSLQVETCTYNTTTTGITTNLLGTTTSQITRCIPVANARIQISGNATLESYSGSNGKANFYDLDVDKTYWIAVNKTGWTVVNPLWNSSVLITDQNIRFWRVELVPSEEVEGATTTPSQDAEEFRDSLISAGEWADTIIPKTAKTPLWLVVTSIATFGISKRMAWQMGAIIFGALTLAGTFIGWLPAWIGICIIIIDAFLVMKVGGNSVGG